jgi:membrane-associated phospholipid phosphatase
MANKEIQVKILIFILFLTTIILTESFYRNKLFNKSLTTEKNIQNFFGKKFFKSYFKFFAFFGDKLIILPYIIFICTSPINYSIIQIFILDISIYFTTFFKSIYKNPRPFWINNELLIECNGGYGNPSGHSISNTSIYLSMAYFLSNYKLFKKSKLSKIIIYICFLFLIFNIIFSRLYLGVHSINQVIYGFLIGLCIFYFVFFIFQIQKKNPKEFLDFIDYNKLWIILTYIILFFIPFSFIFINNKNKERYTNIIN